MVTDARTLIVQALGLSLALHLATLALPPLIQTAGRELPPPLEVELKVQAAREQGRGDLRSPASEAVPQKPPELRPPEPKPAPAQQPEPKLPLVEAVRPVPTPTPESVATPAPSPSLPQPTAVTAAVVSPPSRPVLVPKPVPVLSAPPPIVDTTWYSARQLDVMPRPLGPLQPAYPRQARRDGITGSVVLRLHIDEHGAVDTVEIAESTPPGVFDVAVLKQANGVRFSPGQRDGKPVRATLNVRLRFELEGD